MEAARFWRKYAPVLAELGVLTQVDEPALQMASEHFEVALRAARQLHDEELTVEGREGPRKNPLAQILRDNSGALKGWLVELGMTPASRSKISMEGEQPSLLDEFFARVMGVETTGDPLEEMRAGDAAEVRVEMPGTEQDAEDE